MISVSKNVPAKIWNDALAKAEYEGTIFQSTYWADHVKKLGDHPVFVYSTDKKGDIDGLLLAVQSCYGRYAANNPQPMSPLGKPYSYIYKNTLGPVLDNIFPFILWQNGPVILKRSLLDKSSSEKIYRGLVDAAHKISEGKGYFPVKFARPSYFFDPTELLVSMGFKQKRMGTILVDLAQPLDVVWQRIDNPVRRYLKKNEANCDVFETSRLAELRDFYAMHVQATQRLGIKTYPFSHFASLWESFHSLGKFVGFTATFRGKPISSSISLMHNGIIHEYAYADSDFARLNRIHAIDILKWHIIKWARELNVKYFDLSGVELYRIDAGDEKARNIYRFKSKWGGKLVESHDYQMTHRSRKLNMLHILLSEGEGYHT